MSSISLNHLASIEQKIRASKERIKLIVIDPVTAYVGRTGVNDHKGSELRGLLSPLAQVASRCEVAVVLVMHFNKAPTVKAVHRVIDGVGYVNSERASYVVTRDPDDKERRLMLPLKNNLVRDPNGLAFSLDALPGDEAARIVAGHGGHLGPEDQEQFAEQRYRPTWRGPVSIKAGDAIAVQKPDRSPTKVEDRAAWIKERLDALHFWPLLCPPEPQKRSEGIRSAEGVRGDQKRKNHETAQRPEHDAPPNKLQQHLQAARLEGPKGT